MTGALTSIYAVQFLTQVLRSDEMLKDIPGGIWHDKPKRGSAYPYIVFSDVGSKAILGTGAVTVAGDARFLVKVIGEAEDGQDFGTLVPWAERLSEVLEEASGPVTEAVECQGAYCEVPVLYHEQPANGGVTMKTIWHVGGIWSLFLS